jgi:hypothetical protein
MKWKGCGRKQQYLPGGSEKTHRETLILHVLAEIQSGCLPNINQEYQY